jgi:signal transduction histidine kinase
MVPQLIATLVAVMTYNAVIIALLRRNRVGDAFKIGFLCDNVTLLTGWVVAARVGAGSMQTDDLYLVIFPVLVVNLARLKWQLGVAYTLCWLVWMSWTTFAYFSWDSYSVRQLPLRLVFIAVTSLLVMRVVALWQRERSKEADRLRQMEDMEQLKSRILLTVSHELKSPLTAIKADVDLLPVTASSEASSRRDRVVQSLRSGVYRLENLIQESVAYSDIKRMPVEVTWSRLTSARRWTRSSSTSAPTLRPRRSNCTFPYRTTCLPSCWTGAALTTSSPICFPMRQSTRRPRALYPLWCARQAATLN